MTEKKMKLEFAPGAFDSFEGTQEELNELVAEIQRMFDSGEMLEKSRRVDIDELIEGDPELAETIARQLDDDNGRTLQ
jgi:hypothetical protein